MLPIKINLPSDFLNEEIRDGFKVLPETKKLWAVLLDLLNEFMGVCKRNDLCFYGCAGTILGATRHKGIIPWDDDIDVMMPRTDYDKLCSIASREFNHPYFFQTENTDPGCIRGHAQLRNSLTTGIRQGERGLYTFNQGVFLDIFPLDNITDDIQQRLDHFKHIRAESFKLRVVRAMHIPYRIQFRHNFLKMVFNNGIRFLTDIVDSPFKFFKCTIKPDMMKAYIKYENAFQVYNKGTTNYYNLTPFCISRFVWDKADFDGTPVLLDFEMLKLPVPPGYKHMLDQTYGNWSKFVIAGSMHGDLFFDAEIPYTKLLNK